ncbi:glycoside hydrolase family 13 protein [Bifidobacterium amazonense]|uniref:Glycoside hydrolase family 13 protein n=1 Tax=Bifidobacterium amazonense TaxID=2809027 RepID=A0ABS9VUD0_9BIFI|nr:alpha-amylase family glycosyl hydrolase [Bifidobacterium amazonense]MCH9275694.1 glycoside hydrolase family 13 protein [Bifidobacterium amazonense]MCH9275722.1 glycoside hydrolase family 13 protein [Bifidobacterium amazonense]
MTSNNTRDDWWKQAVVYQIYPRSFKDVNGDGLGDIAGITEKMPYLKTLGVDAIWLSPFYPSDLADGGYDVIDYRNVDPRLGTMDDFDAMAAAAREAGIKIIVDIVPNHTSNRHKLFQAALAAAPGSPERDRYIFREGRGSNGELPPNDWQAMFGGPAWERVPDGQWYLHIFTKEQPDVNWDNPDIHEEFAKTLRFWSDHGADGFRIDVAHGLAKDLDSVPLADQPADSVQNALSSDGLSPLWDRPEVHDIYREWREIFNEYDPPRFAVGEAWVVPEHQHLYASTDELGQVFNFEFAKANWDAAEMRAAIAEGLDSAAETGDSTTTWVMNNHDVPRSPSRYGLPQVTRAPYHQLAHDWLLRNGGSYEEDRELGARRARAAVLMEMGLPGSVYVYQGEELGLPEVADIPWDRLEDPTPFNTLRNFTDKGRDGCRVPLPWDSTDVPAVANWSPEPRSEHAFGTGASFGFSPATRPDGSHAADPHLPQPLWYKDYAADAEERDPESMLNLYRRVLSLRAGLLTATADTSTFDWLDMGDDVIAYRRPSTDDDGRALVSVTNFGADAIELPSGEPVLASVPLVDGLLPSDASVWLLQ